MLPATNDPVGFPKKHNDWRGRITKNNQKHKHQPHPTTKCVAVAVVFIAVAVAFAATAAAVVVIPPNGHFDRENHEKPIGIGGTQHDFQTYPLCLAMKNNEKPSPTAPASDKLERLANLRPVPTGVSDISKSSRYGRVPVS